MANKRTAADHRRTIGPAWRSTPIVELELPSRLTNALTRGHILTAGDAADAKDSELLRIPEFGRKSLTELREALAEWFGISPKHIQHLRWDEQSARDNVEALERRLESARAHLEKISAEITRLSSPSPTGAAA